MMRKPKRAQRLMFTIAIAALFVGAVLGYQIEREPKVLLYIAMVAAVFALFAIIDRTEG